MNAHRLLELQLEVADAVDGFEEGQAGGQVQEGFEETVPHGIEAHELWDEEGDGVVTRGRRGVVCGSETRETTT